MHPQVDVYVLGLRPLKLEGGWLIHLVQLSFLTSSFAYSQGAKAWEIKNLDVSGFVGFRTATSMLPEMKTQ